jgi:hypothetical protein
LSKKERLREEHGRSGPFWLIAVSEEDRSCFFQDYFSEITLLGKSLVPTVFAFGANQWVKG